MLTFTGAMGSVTMGLGGVNGHFFFLETVLPLNLQVSEWLAVAVSFSVVLSLYSSSLFGNGFGTDSLTWSLLCF